MLCLTGLNVVYYVKGARRRCSRLDAPNCCVRANHDSHIIALLHMLFLRKCLSSFDGTVKRSAIEIRRLVVIARCNMYWIFPRTVLTVLALHAMTALSTHTCICIHVAIRLQAVLIRKVLFSIGFTFLSWIRVLSCDSPGSSDVIREWTSCPYQLQ